MSSKDSGRSMLMIVLILLTGSIFLVRLIYIQVFDKDYKIFAENNTIRKETIFPERGLIYDRKNRILVRNKTIYDVMVVPAKTKDFDTAGLCKLLEVNPEDFLNTFNKAKFGGRKYLTSPIVRAVTPQQLGRFQERLFEFRGFFVQERTARIYPISSAAHAIGYLGEVNDDEISEDSYYTLGDFAGKSGLEKQYESVLRGKKGERKILVDKIGREQGKYLDGKEDIAPLAGKDIMTGLDLTLQQYAEKLLQGKNGSVVAIEPATGEILAMASNPSYDANTLLGRDRSKNYAKLILDPDKPLFNRAISARYPPGSTIKPMEALIALNEKIITPSYSYTCTGGYHLGEHTIGCHSSGTFNVHTSIQYSCNTYYCNIFKMIMEQPRFRNSAPRGLEDWEAGLQLFGVGKKIGVDIPNESRGLLPSVKFYNKHYHENYWKATTIMSLGIGQAEISLTPLQLAMEASTIANRGYYITPHFVRAVADKDKQSPMKWEKHESGIDKEYFEIVADAMQDVVEHGTAYLAKTNGIQICGKTGTAQNPHGEDHSVFISFAPKVNPRIALAVVIENAGTGGVWAAPIGSLIIGKYLKDTITNKGMYDWVLSNWYIDHPSPKSHTKPKKKEEKKKYVNENENADNLPLDGKRKNIAFLKINSEARKENYD